MSLQKHVIVGVHITDRIHHVDPVQQLLTESGCSIRTRLGLHDADEKFCSPNGLLLLEMIGTDETHDKLVGDLNQIEGVEAKKMVFDHP
jgi:hypothetical protein